MTITTKAACLYCNGTGIDPTVGFLDCEFCTPAYAGVSLSAPEQPEPNCTTCSDRGEIGCLRSDGYDGEQCPDCNPATVKRYYVGKYGLVEGEALGRISVVLGADHDRITAERDALQLLLNDRDEQLHTLVQSRRAEFDNGRAAEQRNDELLGLLRRIGDLRGTLDQHGLLEEVDAAIKPTAEACKFPQSCTTRCDCDIPDFSPRNGNKARRRAELLGFKIAEDPTLPPGQIKLVQPMAKCVDPFTVCLECFGSGTICTGIEEASSTICNKCDGTGTEKK